MTISMTPYLNFDGNANEAMSFYQGIFGGELTVSTFGDFGLDGMPADGTMHASLTTEHFQLMASDAMPGAADTWKGCRNYIALTGDDVETLTRWFDALAEGGHVGTPLEKQMWGDMYGNLTDRYGIEWMVNAALPQESA